MNTTLLAQITNPVLQHNLGQGGAERGTVVLGGYISAIIGGMLIVGFFTALIFFITGAFHWITSGGDKQNLEHARNKIIHALIGLIILFSVWAVMTIVAPFVGLTFPNISIPTIQSILTGGQ